MLAIIFAALLIGAGIYLYRHPDAAEDKAVSTHAMSDEIIKQRWRELGFYCELDDERKTWRLIGSRAGLLYFPDLLLGYVNDPQNATDGQRKHYGPYGSLEVMTWREPGLDSTAIRGSIDDLTRLAELVGAKLATAEVGATISIREEYAPASRYTLILDVRPDGFDPSSTDRDSLGKVAQKDVSRSS